MASNPTFPPVHSPLPGSPNSPPRPGSSDSITLTPPGTQHPTMWPPHTQPLFTLANVISMAMSMAQSFIPPTGLTTQEMISYPGFHPQMPGPIPPQTGYPSVYPPHYQSPPGEFSYPTVGIPAQNNVYHRPNPQMENFPQSSSFNWQHPVLPPSMASSPPLAPQEQQAGLSSPPRHIQEDGGHVPPHTGQVQTPTELRSDVSSANSLSDPSPESTESTVSHL